MDTSADTLGLWNPSSYDKACQVCHLQLRVAVVVSVFPLTKQNKFISILYFSGVYSYISKIIKNWRLYIVLVRLLGPLFYVIKSYQCTFSSEILQMKYFCLYEIATIIRAATLYVSQTLGHFTCLTEIALHMYVSCANYVELHACAD